MRDFKTLEVWQKAHQLTLNIYHATALMPSDERYGLISQMRRSSASIPTNIAEGCGRTGDRELGQFLSIAMGSASELEYQLILSRDLHLLQDTNFQTLNDDLLRVKRMLYGFMQSLKGSSTASNSRR